MHDKHRQYDQFHSVELDTKDFKKGTEVLLAKFENGKLASENGLKTIKYLMSGSQVNLTQFKRKLVIAETDRLQYVGANFGPYCARYSSCCEYYVGVLNKKTSKMQLINCEWYNLKPTLSGSIFGITHVEETKPLDKPKFHQRDELTMSFGSLKKQRVVESRIRHNVGDEDLEEVIQNAVVDVSVDSLLVEVTPDDPLKEIIPPINRNAKSVEDVYKVKDIISEDELATLENIAETMSNASSEEIKTWTLEEKYGKFVLECMKMLPVEEEARFEKCKLLIYMQFLIYLLNLKVEDLKKNDPLSKEVPNLIKKNLIATYLQKTARNSAKKAYNNISAKNKDKLIAHIIVLALLINDFHFNCERLLIDLKITAQKFKILVKAVGATFQKATGRLTKTGIVTLSLPLVAADWKIRGVSKKRQFS